MRRNKLKPFGLVLALSISIGALAALLWGLSLAGSLLLPALAEGAERQAVPRPAQIPLPARVVTTIVADVLSRVHLPLLLHNYPLGWLRGAGFPADRPAYSLIACDQTVYAGNEHAIYRSEDGGLNWQSVWSGNLDILDLASPDNCATLYAATWGGGVLKSSDGVTWSPLTNGLEDNHWLYAVTTGRDARTVYAGTATGGVYRTTDAGASWSPLGATQLFSDVRSLLVGQIFFNDVVQAGTASGLYRWQDSQWQAEPGLERKKVWSLAVDPHWPLDRYAGIDKAQGGGVFVSKMGQAWTRLTGSPSDTVHALVIDGQTIYAGTRDSGVYISKDGGRNWEPFNPEPGSPEIRSLALSGDRLIAGTKGGVWWFPLK